MSLDEMLKELQRDYLQSLPAKLDDIRKQIDAGAVETLGNSFHKLKGTGKTYGIPEISELAAAMENICHDQPKKAPRAAATAVQILEDIRSARVANTAFTLEADPRFRRLVAS